MIKAIVSDFSRVILFPKDPKYDGSLNTLHKENLQLSGYNPLDCFELNIVLLDFYRSQVSKVNFYIFTTDSIQDAPEFKPFLEPIFTKIFSAQKMGVKKNDSDAYMLIARELACDPSEIIYIDDAIENIEAAKISGLKTILYSSVNLVAKKVTESLTE